MIQKIFHEIKYINLFFYFKSFQTMISSEATEKLIKSQGGRTVQNTKKKPLGGMNNTKGMGDLGELPAGGG